MSLQDTQRVAPRARQGLHTTARRPRSARTVQPTAHTVQGLETAEQAAGALAHDFNNLLTVILAASERLADAAPAGSPERELARVCLDAAERGSELLARMVSLSAAPAAPAVVDCAHVAATVRRFVLQAAPGDIRVELSGQKVRCAADAPALETAVLNLSLNALDAMPQGGVLTLDTREVALTPAAAERLGLAPGVYARISVSDTGLGMSADTLSRAMEPFFTTKRELGTGLGLASARSVAHAAGGVLSLASEPGEGTVASLYLPMGGQGRARA